MKKCFIASICLAALFSAVSCEKPAPSLMVTQSITATSEATKTSLDDTKHIIWKSTDCVKAYATDKSSYTANNSGTNGSTEATFNFDTPSGTTLQYAVYPSACAGSINDDGYVSLTLPTKQTAVANSFADGANASIARVVNGEAYFYNVGALLGVKIMNSDIKAVSIEGENIAGDSNVRLESNNSVTVHPNGADRITMTGSFAMGNTYYFVVYPGTYNGFKIIFDRKDGSRASFSSSDQVTLASNQCWAFFQSAIPDSKWSSDVWTVKGSMNGDNWENCFFMTEVYENVWMSYEINFADNDEFKFKKVGTSEWIGGSVSNGSYYDVKPNTVAEGGSANFRCKWPGTHRIVLDLRKTTTRVYFAYSIIGAINGSSWNKDFLLRNDGEDFYLTDVSVEGEFKFREFGTWAHNWGSYGNYNGSDIVLDKGIYSLSIRLNETIETNATPSFSKKQ